MTTTLTDRYVAATLRRLPARQRADIDTELRGLIADAVDGREASGATPADAEVQALTELGDPAQRFGREHARSKIVVAIAQ